MFNNLLIGPVDFLILFLLGNIRNIFEELFFIFYFFSIMVFVFV
jgi:hypothetical protein